MTYKSKKITIKIITLLFFLMLGTAEAMKAQDFTVTVSASPSAGGYITHTGGTWSGNTGTYTSGETATITATPNTGWFFDKWSDGNNKATRKFTSNTDLIAYFVPTSIGSSEEWGYFCDAIANGCRYTGKTVTLTNDITIDRMAGKINDPSGANGTAFRGTFNGNGHTLTLEEGDFGTEESPITVKYRAPFYLVENGRIENLTVNGDIYMGGNGKYAGGLIATATTTNTIENCVSAVNIHSSVSGDGFCGGFLGTISKVNKSRIKFKGCAFVGQLLGANTKSWGGFVGYRDYQAASQLNYAEFTNCLCAPTAVNIYNDSTTSTFCRSYNNTTEGTTFDNCYYLTPIQNVDGGKQAYSISAGDYITVARSGSATTTYSVSGITAYSTGIIYNGTLYGGSSESIGLSLSYYNPGEPLAGYTAINGTLTGSAITGTNDAYTLSSITGNVIINAGESEPFTVSATEARRRVVSTRCK